MAITLHSSPPMVALAGNAMEFDFSTDKYAEDFMGMHFKINVYNEDTHVYDEATIEKRVTPDDLHHCKIDVSKILRWNPDKAFTYPGNTTDLIIKRNDLRKKYYLSYSEKYGIPLAEYNADDTDPPQYVLAGGLSKIIQSRYNLNDSSWWADKLAESPKTFLSRSLPEKNSDALAPERLYFMFMEDKANIYLNVKVYYEDYPNGITTVRKKITGVDIYDIFEIDTSYLSLGLGFTDDATFGRVLKWDVWLSDDSSAYSEVKTFVPEEVYNQNTRHFMFNNSFGVPECIHFTGLLKGKSVFNSEVANFIIPADSVPSDSGLNYLEASEQRSFVLNSGWISLEEVNLFREFLSSRRRYWITNSMAIPITVKNADITTGDGDEHLYQVEIEFYPGFEDEFPADDLTPEEVEAENYGIGAELTSLGPHIVGNEFLSDWDNTDFNVFTNTGKNITSAQSTASGQSAKSNAISLEEDDIVSLVYTLNLAAGPLPTVKLWSNYSNCAASDAHELSGGTHSLIIEPYPQYLEYPVLLKIESAGVGGFSLTPSLKLTINSRFINESYNTFNPQGEQTEFEAAEDIDSAARTIELTTVLPGDILVFQFENNFSDNPNNQRPKIAIYDDDYSGNPISEEIEIVYSNYVLLRVHYINNRYALVDCYARVFNTDHSHFTLQNCSLKKVNTEFLKQIFHENNY